MVCRIVPQVRGLVSLGHVNFPPISRQAPLIGGRMYHTDRCITANAKVQWRRPKNRDIDMLTSNWY